MQSNTKKKEVRKALPTVREKTHELLLKAQGVIQGEAGIRINIDETIRRLAQDKLKGGHFNRPQV